MKERHQFLVMLIYVIVLNTHEKECLLRYTKNVSFQLLMHNTVQHTLYSSVCMMEK
jgi:hypothetical protein